VKNIIEKFWIRGAGPHYLVIKGVISQLSYDRSWQRLILYDFRERMSGSLWINGDLNF